MAAITLGSKAKNYALDVSDIDLNSLVHKDFDLSILPSAHGRDTLKLTFGKGDYLELQGSFSLKGLFSGSIGKAIDEVTQVTVVENGKVSYTVSGVRIDGGDLTSTESFAKFLFSENYKITGNATNNVITAADHNDTLRGLGGNDKLYGLDGNDRLYGGDGNDFLFGGNFNDVLKGDAGRDVLNGGRHNDILTGGAGSDTFVFGKKFGTDRITDFDAVGRDHDVLDLSGYAKSIDFGKLDVYRHKGDLVIDFNGHDAIILEGVKLRDLDRSDFDF